MLRLELSVWTHHLNHLLYSYFYFCRKNRLKINVRFNLSVPHNSAILYIDNKTIFFDYSDDSVFTGEKESFDFYFKRSLRAEDYESNVYPLNFNVPLSYKALQFLMYLRRDFLGFRHNRTEVARALDYFALKSNSAHSVIDIRKFPSRINRTDPKVLFNTRLWNPDNHPDKEEKERREKQNKFRINACRIIRKEFENSEAGLFPDNYAKAIAPDIILDEKKYTKKNYLKSLKDGSICIADDGLKDNPGWKIGEYLLYGKAVITTPLNIVLDNFKDGLNYIGLSDRLAYSEIPEAIFALKTNEEYLAMGERNFKWSREYIHPENYLKRILGLIGQDIK